jgi:hypothetical protein
VKENGDYDNENTTEQTLVPSYEYDSLYNNVPYESVLSSRTTSDDDDDESMETLPMHKLTNVFVENILLYYEAYKFVQGK